jgi:hypothetical protein
MKKEYTWFIELKNFATGLGWNEGKQTVDCSKEWWDEQLAVRTKLISHAFEIWVDLLIFSFNFRDATILRKVPNVIM